MGKQALACIEEAAPTIRTGQSYVQGCTDVGWSSPTSVMMTEHRQLGDVGPLGVK